MKIGIILTLLTILNLLKQLKGTKTKNEEDLENEDPGEEESELLILNQKNYKNYIKTEKFFVLFHNPWCKFSQNLEKKLKYINKLLKMEQQPFYIGIIDCTLEDCKEIILNNFNQEFLTAYISYPKLIFYEKGSPIEIYNDKFNKNDIYIYMKRKIYKESIHLPILAIFESKIVHDKKAFIYFGDFKGENKNSFDIYNKIAGNMTDIMFYHTNDEKVYKKLNPEREASLNYYSFGRKIAQLDKQNFHFNDLIEFVKKNTFVNFYHKFSEDAINEIFIRKQSALILFRNVFDNSTSFLEENFSLLANSHQNLKFVITDLTGKYEMKLSKLLEVQNLPALRIIDFTPDMRKFELTREFTIENVLNFIKLWKDNKLQSYQFKLNTQEIEQKKDSNVKKISISSYYENVIFNRKNAVILFYTNWCSHCKKLSIILEVVAKRFNPGLISFFSVDVEEANNSPYTEDIRKVPEIYIYTIKDKEHPIVYTPEIISANPIYQFIAEKTFLKETKSDL